MNPVTALKLAESDDFSVWEILSGKCYLFADIDYDLSPRRYKKFKHRWMEETADCLEAVMDSATQVAARYGVHLDVNGWRVLQSKVEEHKPKISFHILHRGEKFSYAQQQMNFWKEVDEYMQEYYWEWCIRDKAERSNQGCSMIDLGVYSKGRAFRLIKSRKAGRDNPLWIRLAEELVDPRRLSTAGQMEYLVTCNDKRIKLSKLSGDRKTYTGRQLMGDTYESNPDKQARKSRNSKRKVKAGDVFEVSEESSGLYRLNRRKPGMCAICDRVHEGDNALYNPKEGTFQCFRQPRTWLKIELDEVL